MLRDVLGLTGSKEGCNNGNCGACSVILDGVLVNSCCVLGVEMAGREVTTIEGIASPDGLHPLQQKFSSMLPCSVASARRDLLSRQSAVGQESHPTEHQVRYWLAGNLCRCTGYDKIIRLSWTPPKPRRLRYNGRDHNL